MTTRMGNASIIPSIIHGFPPFQGRTQDFGLRGAWNFEGGLKTFFTGPFVVKFLTIFLFIEYKIVKVRIFGGA